MTTPRPATVSSTPAPLALAPSGPATLNRESVAAVDAYRSGDTAKAFSLWSELAENGVLDAQVNLANLYQSGIGVERDYVQAVIWYRKAADQGVPTAQTGLGSLYYLGQGVAQDFVKAMFWFAKAADQGDPLAQFALGRMYGMGQGVAVDRATARMWLQLASEAGSQPAAAYNQQIVAEMSENENAKSIAQLNDWHRAHPGVKPQ